MSVLSELNLITILLVEDNPGDVRLVEEIFQDGKIYNRLQVARDGEQAMDYLHQRGDFQNAPRPDLILLDLNLPKKDGLEVLAEVKADPILGRIPVVVLTTSQEEQDILKSYELRANCYVTKPVDLHQFMHVVHCIKDFWLTVVKLPPSNEL